MGAKMLTKGELAGRLEGLWEEPPYFSTHFLTKEDFTPFLRADLVWCWEAAELPAAEAADWLRQNLRELRRREGGGIGRCLLYLWASTAHNLEVLERVIGALSWETERMLFDILLREDLEKTELGLLLLAVRADQSVSKETPRHSSGALPLLLGWDQGGHGVAGDLEKLHHLLIAGRVSTGLGEYITFLLEPLLHLAGGQAVQVLLLPSSGGKLLRHAGDPHLLLPVTTDAREAIHALRKAVMELERRHRLFSMSGVKDIQAYNALADTAALPVILVVLEELADMMEAVPDGTEEALCEIARQGHTAGVHLILATSRPSPQVLTGFLKANLPSRIAFAAGSAMESRVMIDASGAERLGEGELLYWPLGETKPIRLRRVQTTGISEENGGGAAESRAIR